MRSSAASLILVKLESQSRIKAGIQKLPPKSASCTSLLLMHQFYRIPAEASVRIDALGKYESRVKLSNSTNKKDPDLYLAAKRPGSARARRISIDVIKIIVLQKKQRQRKNKSTPARAMPNLHRNRKACAMSTIFTKFAKLERPLL